MPRPPDELLTVGVLTKPHGIRGELRLHPFNRESSLWDRVEHVVLLLPSGPVEREVLALRMAPKHVVVSLADVEGRVAAEALRGVEVAVRRADLPPLEEGEFYFVDLVGLPLVRDGVEVGRVEGVIEYPSVDCLEVRAEDGVREVPILEPWVVAVEADAGRIVVGPWDDIPVR